MSIVRAEGISNVSYNCATDLAQYRAVSVTKVNNVSTVQYSTTNIIWVTQFAGQKDYDVAVKSTGYTNIEAGETLVAGDFVKSDANWKAVKATDEASSFAKCTVWADANWIAEILIS